MATTSYQKKLLDPRWQKKRLEIFNRDKFTCKMCGDTNNTLHIHHLKYVGNPWDIDNDFLITYCKDCHEIVEEFKKNHLKVLSVTLRIADFNNIFREVYSVDDSGFYKVTIFQLDENNALIRQMGIKEESLLTHLEVINSLKLK